MCENIRLAVINKSTIEESKRNLYTKRIEIGNLLMAFVNRNMPGRVVLKVMDIDKSIMNDIVERTKKEVVMYDLSDLSMMGGFGFKAVNLLDYDSLDESHKQLSVYVLTNTSRFLGASAILFTDVLKKIYNLLGTDYYILPVTVHEVLIIPVWLGDMEEINGLFKEILVFCTKLFMEGEMLDSVPYIYSDYVNKIENLFK